MKNVLKLSAIFCFVLLLTSCEKDKERIQVQASSEDRSSFKDEDEEIIFVNIPTILGSLTLTQEQHNAGVTANLVGIDVSYDETTIVSLQGTYAFTNVPVGTYRRKILVGSALNDMVTYIVNY